MRPYLLKLHSICLCLVEMALVAGIHQGLREANHLSWAVQFKKILPNLRILGLKRFISNLKCAFSLLIYVSIRRVTGTILQFRISPKFVQTPIDEARTRDALKFSWGSDASWLGFQCPLSSSPSPTLLGFPSSLLCSLLMPMGTSQSQPLSVFMFDCQPMEMRQVGDSPFNLPSIFSLCSFPPSLRSGPDPTVQSVSTDAQGLLHEAPATWPLWVAAAPASTVEERLTKAGAALAADSLA
ncbi:hypothetical protein DFP72DRAFT_1045386 [Ephemerocybe angulata]|uniref:Uncharacterized protein n=1 Tax=Ephemerocybe angulata TaxID=980116 RepID=A0A8H6M850_9AGAR|nr:hypothetical protein DFP72DRAFT_1045386 [Tulosesus angulatus]